MSSAWVLAALKQACEAKSIQVKEPTFLSELPALTVVRGETIVIYLCPTQSAEAKLWSLARELARLALGHLSSRFRPSRVREPVHAGATEAAPRNRRDRQAPRDALATRREREVGAWAVHALVAISTAGWAAAGDVDGQTTWMLQGDVATPIRAGDWDLRGDAPPPGIALGDWVRYRDWSFVPSPRDWLKSGPPRAGEVAMTDQRTWAQTFLRSYRLVIAARDFWRSLCQLADAPAIVAAWSDSAERDGADSAPLVLLRCAPAAPPGGPLDTASHDVWEVVVWYCRRRWSTTLRSRDQATYAVVAASWDPVDWRGSVPPWSGQRYDDWVAADCVRGHLTPIFTSRQDDAANDVDKLLNAPSSRGTDGAERPAAASGAGEAPSSQAPAVPSEPDADPPARPHVTLNPYPAVRKRAARRASSRTFVSSLAMPDAPAWHGDPAYSPRAARALVRAYRYVRRGAGDIHAPVNASRSVVSVGHARMSPRQHLRILFVLAWAAKSLGDYPAARGWLESGLEQARDLGDSSAMIELLFMRGAIYRATSHLAAAADDYRECLRFLDAFSEDDGSRTRGLTLDLRARIVGFEFFLARYDTLDQHLAEARRLVSLSPDAELPAATIEWVQALLFRWQGQSERALRHALAAVDVYTRWGQPLSRVRIEACAAEIGLDLAFALPPGTDRVALAELALAHVRAATTLASEVGDDAGEGLALLTYVRYSRVRGLEEDRIAAVERVMRTARRFDDLALLAQAFNTLADEQASRGEVEIAANCYREVLDLLDGSDLPALAIPARRALLRAEEMRV